MKRIALLMTLAFGLAAPAAAELVVLTTGTLLKVEGYDVRGDEIELQLPFGGTLVLALRRVERIVDDELTAPGDGMMDRPRVDIGFSESETIPQTRYTALFERVGRKYSLSSKLLASIARAESAFQADAVSAKGAMGLMQVMPATARRFGVDPEKLYDPLVSLDVGARYLALLRERYAGDLTLMLAAYNAGEATVERYGGVPPYRETETYIDRVYETYTQGSG